jgi:hypothetical protein
VIWLTGVVSLMGASPVVAQSNSRTGSSFIPPGLAKKAPGSSTTVTSTPQTQSSTTGSRLQTFGTWLDTAAVSAPGETWMWISTAYWRSRSLREIDAPSMGVSVGVAPRTQVGVSLPYYYLTDRFGSTWHGFGASYVTTKFAVTQNRRVNLSTSPTLEILSWTSPGIRRVNWVLPISVESGVGAGRVYGSTGYFSRGSVFGAGAAEWSAGSRGTLVASLSHSYSVKSDPLSDALAVSRHRTDASGSLYLRAGSAVVFFASVGRTLAPVTETSGRLSLSGGVTINVAGPSAHTPRVP